VYGGQAAICLATIGFGVYHFNKKDKARLNRLFNPQLNALEFCCMSLYFALFLRI
jgi:hypothetical protein